MQILFGTLKTYFMLRIDHRFMTPEDCPKGSMCPPKRNIFDIYENIGFFITISPNYGSVGFLFLFFFIVFSSYLVIVFSKITSAHKTY